MMKNVGGMDRVLRLVAGIVILGLGYYYQSWWGLLGVLGIGTAFIRWCPAYLPFGISTARKSS